MLLGTYTTCISPPAGEAVLIPAPYYPAFDNDLTVKCAIRPVPFHLDEQRPVGPQLQVRGGAVAASQTLNPCTHPV